MYFNSPSGCWFGDHCRFSHVKGVAPRCRFFSGPGTCRNGSQCYFRHVDLEGPTKKLKDVITSEVDKGIASALQKLSMSSDYAKSFGSKNKTIKENDESKKEPTAEGDTRKVVCKEKSAEVDCASKLENDKPGSETIASPPEDNSCSKKEEQDTCVDKNSKMDKSGSIKCGECGKLIHMKMLPGVSNEEPDDAEDDGKSVSSTDSDVTHKYNELEQHYYYKLLSMNKDHLGFLQHDPRFHKETLCNVCGRVFGKTRHLLQHITDKVKSGSDDEENHTELLHELVLAFTTRDIGLDDDKECMDTLLLQLVASYTGDSDSSSDSNHRNLGDFFRILAMKEHLGDSDDSDYACNPWGFDEDDMFELACQGIKPWDPEAGMALAVLNGYIDI